MNNPSLPQDLLTIVIHGELVCSHKGRRPWFWVRHCGNEINGPLVIRPDWAKRPGGRPGVMPIIEAIQVADTSSEADVLPGRRSGLSDVHAAVRDRISQMRVVGRAAGKWRFQA